MLASDPVANEEWSNSEADGPKRTAEIATIAHAASDADEDSTNSQLYVFFILVIYQLSLLNF